MSKEQERAVRAAADSMGVSYSDLRAYTDGILDSVGPLASTSGKYREALAAALPKIELVVARAGISGVTDEAIHFDVDEDHRAAAQALVDLRALLSTLGSPSNKEGA